MKFKSTLILLAVFILLLVVVYFFEFRSRGDGTEDMLVSQESEDIEKIIFKNGEQTIHFQRENGEWLITEPVEAAADDSEVNRLANDFSNLRIERVVEEEPADLEKFGIPLKEVELFTKGQDPPVKIMIGLENPLDNTFFAKREGESRVVLISSSLKSLLENGVFEFRRKDIFKFDTDQAKDIKMRAPDAQWEAEKTEDDWYLKKPVESLAQKNKINDVLYSLSNLKATAFLSEKKEDTEMINYGLDVPDYEVVVDLPVENRQVTFYIREKDEKVYATSSASTKILQVEDSISTDLDIAADDLRDKEVVDFFTWEVKKIHITKGDMSLYLSKDEEENWQFEEPETQSANGEKVQSFLQKLESLEADEFLDPPIDLAGLGLETPRAEVKIWTGGEEDNLEEFVIQIGAEDIDSQKVIVKNERFPYAFRVDSTFLEDLPQQREDWMLQEEEKKEDKD